MNANESEAKASTREEFADVVALFSRPSAFLRQRHLSGANSPSPMARSTASDAGDDEVPPAAANRERHNGTNSNSNSSDQLTIEEVRSRLAELENARSPTKSEIREILAQYSDYSSEEGEDSTHSNNGTDAAALSCESSDIDSESDGEETVIMKVLVVGNARCGKTSVIRRLVREDFSDEYVSTIGADFVEKDVPFDAQLAISLQLWDIAGQDRFAKFTRAYFRDAKGAVIVCDITRENTIDAVVNWKKEIDACCRDQNGGETIPVVMIANKSDLLLDPMRALNLGVNMQKCVTQNGIVEWFRASAKSGESVREAFDCLIDRMVANHRTEQRRASLSNDIGEAGKPDSEESEKHIIRLGNELPPPSMHAGKTGYGCECH